MVNNKGYLRILEALMAIVLLFGIVLFVNSKVINVNTGFTTLIFESQNNILNQFALNENIRNCAVYSDYTGECMKHPMCGVDLNKTILGELPIGYGFTCEICNKSLSCLKDDEANVISKDKSVFTSTIFLSGNGTNEKVIRLYYWK